MYEWVKSNTSSMIVTIYPNNLTLNQASAQYFDDVRWCMIGLNKIDLKLAIKPITKREIDLDVYPSENLHKVSIGKGYVRISNKNVINEISSLLNKPMNSCKFNAKFVDEEKVLVVDLSKQE